MNTLYTSPEYLAFLASVIAAPDDDAPRLAFADWLEEQGDAARAEFIRVQIALGRHKWGEHVREGNYDARDGVSEEWQQAFDLHSREMKILWAAHDTDCRNWEAWCWAEARDEEGAPCRADHRGAFTVTPHGSPGLGGNSCGCTVDTSSGTVKQSFRRGFIESVTCDWPTWRDHGDAILAAQPVTSVTLSTMPDWDYVDSDMCIAELYGTDKHYFIDEIALVGDHIPTALCKATWPCVRTWRLPGS